VRAIQVALERSRGNVDPVRDLTIRDLVRERSLGLRLVAGAGRAGTTLRSAHTSDLDQPGRYVLPGELILTSGLWMQRVSPLEWVDEVRLAGAVAIGFGLTAEQLSAPDGLVEWCEALGIPLLEIPEEISFTEVTEHIYSRVRGDEASTLRRQLMRTRRMLLRLAEGGGYEALLELLHRETELTAAFVGPGGRIVAATSEGWLDRSVARRAASAALRGALPSSVSADVSAFGLPTRPLASTLVIASPFQALGDEERLIVEQVAGYAAFEDARTRALEDAARGLTEELVRLVRADEIGETAFAARTRSLGLDSASPFVPIATDLSLDALRYAAETCDVRYAIGQLPGARLLLIEAPPATFASDIAGAARAEGEEGAIGCGSPAIGATCLRRSLAEAEAALRVARARPANDRIVYGGEVGSHTLLLQLLEPATVASYRNAILRPLEQWDRNHHSELVLTLRTFFEQGGKWRETAKQLHIHHNSLRYRLARVEKLTGRSLAQMSDRVDLFLALALAAADDEQAHLNV
jgi:purine catabolism regulator